MLVDQTKLNAIYIIDDDEPTVFLNTLVIERAQVTEQVMSWKNPITAFEHLKKCRNIQLCHHIPDMIFLDINMPEMNGWEFLDEYKLIQPELAKNPVIIMLSTSVNPDDKMRALNHNMVHEYQSKPLNADRIHELVHKYF